MDAIARMCGALTTAGHSCRRAVAPGHTRCNLHGGATPLARQAAQERLAAAALPAAQALLEIIARYGDDRCEVCGMPKGDPGPVIRAAQIVLDRTGFHPSVQVDFNTNSGSRISEYMAWIPRERLTQIGEWLRDARERMARGEPPSDRTSATAAVRLPRTVEDGEIVETEAEGLVLEGNEPKPPEESR